MADATAKAVQKGVHRHEEKLPRLGIVIDSNATNEQLKTFEFFFDGVLAMGIPTMIIDQKKYFVGRALSPEVTVREQLNSSFYNDCDVVIFVPFGNTPKEHLKQAWKRGVVPVVSFETEKTVNYNPNTESGNSFLYTGNTAWEVFAALIRACETFKFPHDWKFLVKQAKKSD